LVTLNGVVSRDPVVVETGPAASEQLLRWAALVLAVVLVLVDPVLFTNLLCLGLVAAFVMWGMKRAGIASPGRAMVAGAAMAARIGRPRPVMPALRLTVVEPAGEWLVHLRGHHAGVFERGDAVTVHALRSPRGVLHALRVDNHHHGVTAWRPGLVRTALWSALVLWLLLSVISHLR
jgi:hypothetical protein